MKTETVFPLEKRPLHYFAHKYHHTWPFRPTVVRLASPIFHPEFVVFVGALHQRNEQEAREAALAARKAEHLKDEASLALDVAREELKTCQLVVDEASEAARLREQVNMAIASADGL